MTKSISFHVERDFVNDLNEALSFVLKSGNVTEADMPGNTEVTAVIEKATSPPSSMWSKALQHRIEGYAYLCGDNS